MNLQQFSDAVTRYDGVQVLIGISYNHVKIIFNKYCKHKADAPRIEFYMPADNFTLYGSEALPPEALLQMSKVMKLTYEYLRKGTWGTWK